MPGRFLSACFRVFLVYSNLFSPVVCVSHVAGVLSRLLPRSNFVLVVLSTGEISLKFSSSL